QLPHPRSQRVRVNTEHVCCAALSFDAASRALEDARDVRDDHAVESIVAGRALRRPRARRPLAVRAAAGPDAEALAVAEDRGALDHSGELAHVAGPRVVEQHAHVVRRWDERSAREALADARGEVGREQRDVALALAKRWQAQREDAQAVPEILA